MKIQIDAERLNAIIKTFSKDDEACWRCPLRNNNNINCPYNSGCFANWDCETALWRWLKGAQN